jgi:hypothetical protein
MATLVAAVRNGKLADPVAGHDGSARLALD